ncbi:prepilin-type N-terminal cleavage/methylation domain-containing protein [Botrimarina sp.]|uniref:prepilin-type N-terminal cleavage/methylation domain-containing protein n=1 Tax=Botrimarina sp. TaxID=2795802 RepID=UPI0032ECA55C
MYSAFRIPISAFGPPPPVKNPRRAITLIELLIAIAIISVLAALLVGVAGRAGEVARDARTRSLVGRIHTLVIERYDLYRTRRVELNQNAVANLAIDSNSDDRSDLAGIYLDTLNSIQGNAAARLAGQRELMKFEMPDRWTDVWGGPLPSIDQLSDEDYAAFPPAFVTGAIPLRNKYLRELRAAAGRDNRSTLMGNTIPEILANQSAECLYLMVMNATGDGEAPSLFNENDVGDTDGDGLREFLDGWGQPIGFLRWAPGFDSDLQWSIASLQRRYDRPPTGLSSVEAVREAVLEDHDPLDVFRLDTPAPSLSPFDATTDALTVRGWRLVPLVFSIGADGEAGIEPGVANYVAYANPYADASGGGSTIVRIGQLTPDLEGYADNLHSHNVGSLSTRR